MGDLLVRLVDEPVDVARRRAIVLKFAAKLGVQEDAGARDDAGEVLDPGRAIYVLPVPPFLLVTLHRGVVDARAHASDAPVIAPVLERAFEIRERDFRFDGVRNELERELLAADRVLRVGQLDYFAHPFSIPRRASKRIKYHCDATDPAAVSTT